MWFESPADVKGEDFRLPHQLVQVWGVRGKGRGEALKSCQQSNIKKWRQATQSNDTSREGGRIYIPFSPVLLNLMTLQHLEDIRGNNILMGKIRSSVRSFKMKN